MTEFEGYAQAPGDVGKIAVIVSRFNKTITDRLLEGALAKFREKMVSEDQIVVVRVPGAFELPTLAQRFACDEDYAAVVCLGCVIKGETSHDEYINRAVSAELARIGSEYCLPVVFGVITCNTIEQAMARSGSVETETDKTLGERPGNKGAEAAEAALEMIDLLSKLPPLYDPEDDEREFESLRKNGERYVRGDFETVEVDPESFEEIDGEDDEEEDSPEWFVRGNRGSERMEDRPRFDGKKREFHRDGDRKQFRKSRDQKDGRNGDSGNRKSGGFKGKNKKNDDKGRRR
ncbi:MAG: 6,7-dimethyl-8-ribityllumazine synthase [Thermoguttaceae bacterium]|nr:6,7-dimethyl-8-ribityllumazine synthase [Thermoguttaceae bacterium]